MYCAPTLFDPFGLGCRWPTFWTTFVNLTLFWRSKTGSNCKTDLKFEFLDPWNPTNAILDGDFRQTFETLILKVADGGHFGFLSPKIFPTLFGGAPSLILFNNLHRRQKVRETDLRTPRSRMCPKWPNYVFWKLFCFLALYIIGQTSVKITLKKHNYYTRVKRPNVI